MPNQLLALYGEWKKSVVDLDPSLLQAFQGGMTAGAVSMRKRAMDIVRSMSANGWDANMAISKIGELSDIPE